MDSSALASLTARFMEDLDSDFVEDAKVGSVSIVAEVLHGHGEDKEATVVVFSNEDRKWIQQALLSEGFMALEGNEPAEMEES